ncbi:MBG domain-containing protein [Flammeovirga sp. EKP202]|uniref:MBG domain-containing protein n=1 Tax=Flammeovirga sp. EKP202 TaxID=2770592 RepID=UPI00165F24D7|nr:MBG domain-containing protein [Flammeovirga sp. EKP202]MBD0405357.1 T9SS type A sorting domain-containing protein [Flammeovirga sp. EKP202]
MERIILFKISSILAFLTLIFNTGNAMAQEDAFYVNVTTGTDNVATHGLSADTPWATLEFALAQFTSDGAYASQDEFNIYISGVAKADAGSASLTTLSGENKVFNFYGEGPNRSFIQPSDDYSSDVQGFEINTTVSFNNITVRNYSTMISDINGPAFKVNTTGQLTLNNVNVVDNHGNNKGGAIYSKGKLKIHNSYLSENTTHANGSVLYVDEGELEMINSVITNNTLRNTGWTTGAVTLITQSEKLITSIKLINNTIYNNFNSGSGGVVGVFVNEQSSGIDQITLANNVFSKSTRGNNSSTNSFEWKGKRSNDLYTTLEIQNNFIDKTNVSGSFTGNGNILDATQNDNILVDYNFVSQNGGNYLRVAVNSPLIDAGNNTFAPAEDKNGQSRVGTSDIGAVEFLPLEEEDFYIDAQNGDDTNAGTIEAPFKTLEHARYHLLGYTGKTLWMKGTFNINNLMVEEEETISFKGWDEHVVFNPENPGRFMEINGTVTLDRVKVSGYSYTENGGAITVGEEGTLNVLNSIFTNNSVVDGETTLFGGAILSLGTLEIYNSYFAENEASSRGSAIAAASGTFIMKNTTVYNNLTHSGQGAVAVYSNTKQTTKLTLENNSIIGNYSQKDGAPVTGTSGVLLNDYNNPIEIVNFSNNLIYSKYSPLSATWSVDVSTSSANIITENTATFRNNVFQNKSGNMTVPEGQNNIIVADGDMTVDEQMNVARELSTNHLGVNYLALLENSIAIDAGDITLGTDKDINDKNIRNERDAGAYEFGGFDIATITLGNTSKVYTGSELQPLVTVKDKEGNDITDLVSYSATYNGETSLPINSGEYAVVVTVDDAGYYGNAQSTFTVTKAEGVITISEEDLSVVYNGDPQEVIATSAYAYTSKYKDAEGTDLLQAPTNVGEYQVTVSINDANYTGEYSDTFVITKAKPIISISDLVYTYNSNAQSATVSVTGVKEEDLSAFTTVTYTQSEVEVTPIEVGEYQVNVSVLSENYEGNTVATLEIKDKLEAKITATSSTIYNGVAQAVSYDITDQNDTPITVNEVTVTYNGTTEVPVNAGSYNLVITIDDPEYKGAYASTYTIEKATPTISISDLSYTYNGVTQSATVSVTGVKEEDLSAFTTVTYTQSEVEVTPIEVGEYQVNVSVLSENYEGNTTATLEIKDKLEAKISAILSTVYNGSSQAVSYSITDQNDTPIIVNEVMVTYNGSIEAPVNAGSYNLVITVNDPEYKGVLVSTYTIEKALPTIEISGLSYIFDGENKEATVAVTGINNEDLSASATVEYTQTGVLVTPKAVGEYIVSVMVNTDNYLGEKTATLVINDKLEASIVITTSSNTYTGEAQAIEYTITNQDGNTITVDQVEVTYNEAAAVPTNAGTYTVKVTVTDNLYFGSEESTYTIEKAIAEVTIADLEQTYDGTEKSVSVATDIEGLQVTITYDGEETVPSEVGEYEVIATIVDDNYEGSATATLKITEEEPPLSVEDDLLGVSVYPNPNNGEFTVDLGSASGSVVVYTISGVEVYSADIMNKSVIKLPSNSRGVLIVKIISGTRSKVQKIQVR